MVTRKRRISRYLVDEKLFLLERLTRYMVNFSPSEINSTVRKVRLD
jgi:hypothetical protein